MPRRPIESFFSDSNSGRSAGDPPDLIIQKPEWRDLFDEKTLEQAARKTLQTEAGHITGWSNSETAIFRIGRKKPCRTQIYNTPRKLNDTWDRAHFSCTCEEAAKGRRCVHMAALLLAWEKKSGPWILKESLYDYQRRKEREAREAVRRQREEDKKRIGDQPVPALDAFREYARPEGLVFFDVEHALSTRTTTPYAISRMKEVQSQCSAGYHDIREQKSRNGQRSLVLTLHYNDEAGNVSVRACLAGGDLVYLYFSQADGAYWPSYMDDPDEEDFDADRPLNEFELAAMEKAWEYMLSNQDSEDRTDSKAMDFFRELELAAKLEQREAAEQAAAREPARKREPVLELFPRIAIELGQARLTFKIGRKGGKSFVLKNMRNLVAACRSEKVLEVTKKESVDFSRLDLCPESAPLMEFIARRVGEVSSVNELLANRNLGRAGQLSVNSFLELDGSILDGFYDAAEGLQCEYTDKTNDVREGLIPIGHHTLRIRLTADKITDARGSFVGVAVSGLIPVMLRGSSSNYTLNAEGLSRISKKEEQILTPFRKVADASGYFRFEVGRDSLQELYYRVLPALLDNPNVFLDDRTGGEVRQFLPPEPEFTLYFDYFNPLVYCSAEVRYEDRKYTLFDTEKQRGGRPSAAYRDQTQERRVIRAIKEWLPFYDAESHRFYGSLDDDRLYDFLTLGFSQLERYGECRGTDAFRRCTVRKMPSVQMGVSLESGLMDLSVTSQDADPEELLEILESYQQKKRYHRLRGGDFVDLSGGGSLAEMVSLLQGLELSPAEAFGKKITLPAYRALYLNQLLEEHDAIASSRSRTYRALIRNFHSIRDAEYETPASLYEILRPYQEYGFKWLRTLEAAGFGGILADEMGLGKTLQMISLFLADREEATGNISAGQDISISAAESDVLTTKQNNTVNAGPDSRSAKTDAHAAGQEIPDSLPNFAPSLVVCPASLVYNWQEEIRRFAPQLRCAVLSGTLGARKKALARMDEGTVDVFVTSYDTLKRDIHLYEGRQFAHCVLDEAQFIKNPKAGVTKAAKAIRAARRFALTGTPIENRLSELWSIFDFLMPGFLFSAAEFSRKYEVPIMKQKDEEATARLRKLTGPFILRRRKEDVLTDLPAKMEEVRYARVEGEQQKLYDAQVIRMKQMLLGSLDGNSMGGRSAGGRRGRRKAGTVMAGGQGGMNTAGSMAGVQHSMNTAGSMADGQDSTNTTGSMSGEDRIRIFAELTRIRQICCDPSLIFENYHGESAKRTAALELIRSAIDGGHRMLVFSQFTTMLALLEEDLQREGIPYFIITGSTPKEKRIALVHEFNEGDVPVFLISLKAGGTGLNLTGADVVIHYDPWWNLAVQNQATDRAHRIGQTRQVTVYRLVLKDTIEERILALQEEKKDLAEAILSGERDSIMSLSGEELLALLS